MIRLWSNYAREQSLWTARMKRISSIMNCAGQHCSLIYRHDSWLMNVVKTSGACCQVELTLVNPSRRLTAECVHGRRLFLVVPISYSDMHIGRWNLKIQKFMIASFCLTICCHKPCSARLNGLNNSNFFAERSYSRSKICEAVRTLKDMMTNLHADYALHTWMSLCWQDGPNCWSDHLPYMTLSRPRNWWNDGNWAGLKPLFLGSVLVSKSPPQRSLRREKEIFTSTNCEESWWWWVQQCNLESPSVYRVNCASGARCRTGEAESHSVGVIIEPVWMNPEALLRKLVCCTPNKIPATYPMIVLYCFDLCNGNKPGQ